MKTSRAICIASVIFLLAGFPLAALTDTEFRKDLLDETKKELAPIEAKEIQASSLGEWNNAINSSLFLLFRKTELFRGQIRVLVIDDDAVISKIYPDGTFVISSGLLDYIDQSLFEETANSPRRIRNFDSEREAAIIPFLAPEAAHFALGHAFAAWKRSQETSMVPSTDENLDADRFALVLLKLAGLDSGVMEESLSSLAKKMGNGTLGSAFADYTAPLPSPEKRLAAIRDAAENIDRIAGSFGIALDALKRGNSFREARDSLVSLAEKVPDAPYVARLYAIVAHLRWIETVSEADQAVPTFFPYAPESGANRKAFIAIATGTAATGTGPTNEVPVANSGIADFPQEPAVSATTPTPGNASLYAEADTAYRNALEMLDEPGLASAYAMLAVRAGNDGAIRNALDLASAAAIRESGTRSFAARANYANLLFLTGTDYAKAQYFIESLASPQARGSDAKYLDTGIPGDSRDLVLSHALMMRALGDTKRATDRVAAIAPLFGKSRDIGSVDLRHLHIGDMPDNLAEKWGRPASIVYNYPTETWVYPSLSASVVLEGKVSRVRIFAHSPLSPGFDVRTGDSRSDFESMFGKPVYRAGDCDVYMKDGNRISVLYLADRIRTITVGL